MVKQEALTIQFEKTVKNLAEVLEKIKTSDHSDRAIFRDSAIQRLKSPLISGGKHLVSIYVYNTE